MTDYLTNLAARSLNKARVIRPRVPMLFESPNKKEPFYQKEPREIAESYGKKQQETFSMNDSVTEDVQFEPEIFFPETKKLPISKSQTPKRTRITNKVISRQPQTQTTESKLTENIAASNSAMEPRQASHVFSISTPKLKRVAPYGYPRVPFKQEPIQTQSLTGTVRTTDANDAEELFPSPETSKFLVDKTQKPSTADATERRMNALMPTNQYRKTGWPESGIVKASLPEKKIGFQYPDSFTEVPGSGRTFTPEVIRKYSQVPKIDAQKVTVEEKSIQVTIGRIEIRAVPPAIPQKQHRTPKVLSLEDYSKRHIQEVDR